jgi:hypothetical protein
MVDLKPGYDRCVASSDSGRLASSPPAMPCSRTYEGMREVFQQPAMRPDHTQVVLRDLADYDTAFGVDIPTGIEMVR